ncbi:VOC family protein [Longispora sp. NPDC051575]|uniref:VOC family protein n=1 Tax=Longispora sp. NPDC051575 TaxID=3154943 RepID=UPI00343DFE46
MTITPGMVTIDCADPARLAAFWTAALGYEVAAEYPGFVILGTGDTLRVGLQAVPEPRTGKNRVHLDFLADDREAEAARLTALGATEVARRSAPGGGFAWIVLADPEGNEFCVGEAG